MKKLLREPLLHFLAAGLALFLFKGYYGSVDVADRSITLDEMQVGRLSNQWQQQWRRPPTPGELDGLIRDYIKEEVYFREAIRLGLETDDPIIRKRLRTKMEFLATAEIENIDPTKAELEAYYRANQVRYAVDPAYSFDQKYYGGDLAKARNSIAALNNSNSSPALSISLPVNMEDAKASDIAREFGEGFAESLKSLPKNRWAGPVQSGFGWHAVRIRRADAATLPPLTDIEQRITNDWRAETRVKREAAAYQILLDSYNIRIAKP